MQRPREHDPPSRFARLTLAVTALALAVVVLGAFVRLSDAGLGCPDWPGCYGRALVPGVAEAATARQWPARPLQPAKAWKEMVHRYAAGTLGLAVLALAVLAWRRRGQLPVALPTALLGLVVFQALLGMWTVTWLLKPVVVVAHLLCGFATLALLWWLSLRCLGRARPPAPPALRAAALAALLVLVVQIALGGWTSSNYAALACIDFPRCRQAWWPPAMDFQQAFVLWRGLGVDYEGGVLADSARLAVHVSHRLGAALTASVLTVVALAAIVTRPSARAAGWAILGLLSLQLSLGIGNVVLGLPLPVATAHNAVAALLLLAVVALLHAVFPPRRATPGTTT